MFQFLHARQREEEWMDAPTVNPKDLRASLVFIRRINHWLGYTRLTLKYLARFFNPAAQGFSNQPAPTPTILDIATGSADIPQAILKWAQTQSLKIKVTAIDYHAETLRIAAEKVPQLTLIRADARHLPFANQSFDYVMTAMFLHHLSEDDVVSVLKEMDRVARHGIIIADLLRHRRAYFWITILTLFASPMVAHDARVSVAQAFTKKEIIDLCEKANVKYTTYRQHFGHRFVLAGLRN